ncbi:MAG: choice-of-anchor B family protein [Flavobacteriales bacterium]
MTKFYNLAAFVFAALVSGSLISQTPCTDGFAGEYPCNHVDLLAFVPLDDIGGGENTNDIWGWVSPNTSREYALVGCSNGTAFVDITEPADPVFLGLLPTHSDNSLWRDLEADNRYCYIGSEADQHGLQIFDLWQLDEVTSPPIDFEETAHYSDMGSSHTITLDPVNKYVYCNGSRDNDNELMYAGGQVIIDVSDPLNPTLAGGYAGDGYTHDSFLWIYDGPDPDYTGKQMLFACNEDELSIIDVTDKTDCQLIESYSYANVGYIHQGWVTKDKSHFLIDDELDEGDLAEEGEPTGTRTHIFDITNLDDADYMGFYESASPSIDHNLYIQDQFVYESNYRSGLRILDAVHIDDGILSEAAYFDLYPANDNLQYSGSWSNYPYLPSGVNIATHMYQGFFILKPNLITLSQNQFELCGSPEIMFQVDVNADIAFPVTFAVEGIPGAGVIADVMIEPGQTIVVVDGLLDVAAGTYNAMLALQTNFGEQYEVPFTLILGNGAPSAPTLIQVPDGSVVSNTAPEVLFQWEGNGTATSYEYQLATDVAFTDIIETQNTSLSQYLMTFNLPDGMYYWRVRASNECGVGQWSALNDFTIAFVNVIEMNKPTVLLFPNPVHNTLYVDGLPQGASISINDLSGRVVKQWNNNKQQLLAIDVSDMATGTYMLCTANCTMRWVKY